MPGPTIRYGLEECPQCEMVGEQRTFFGHILAMTSLYHIACAQADDLGRTKTAGESEGERCSECKCRVDPEKETEPIQEQ